ncbi:MAG: hypothetical protein KGL00_10680 [Gammaproteobacteria bacterium]|nr:hypothetical protein [Gammaproteobacteria bacterium]
MVIDNQLIPDALQLPVFPGNISSQALAFLLIGVIVIYNTTTIPARAGCLSKQGEQP